MTNAIPTATFVDAFAKIFVAYTKTATPTTIIAERKIDSVKKFHANRKK